jgi:hypothetical protein
MKSKRKILWLLALVAGVMIGSTWLITANADDTYNFYFQKAPGPVTVNQGGGAANTGTPDVKIRGEGAPIVSATPSPSPSPSQSVSANTTSMTSVSEPIDNGATASRAFELSFGVSGSQQGGGSTSWNAHDDTARGGLVGNQYSVGLQWNMNRYFAAQAEAFYLMKPHTERFQGNDVPAPGTRLDYAGGLVITPFRLPMGSVAELGIAGVVGYMTAPYSSNEQRSDGSWDQSHARLLHTGSLYYGGRVALDLGHRVSLNATVRRVEEFHATMGTASLAILL